MESIKKLEEIPAAIDLTCPFTIPVIFPKITSNVGEAQIEVNIGDRDQWVNDIIVRSYDDVSTLDGQNLTGSLIDKFSIKIESADGVNFSQDPMDVYALNGVGRNLLFKGWVLKNRTKYIFKLTGQGIPSTACFSNFIKFEIDLMGYKLLAKV